MFPPTDLLVEILATEDIGKVKTKNGGIDYFFILEIKLEKNMTYFLRKSDIEPLLRKGLVTLNE